MAGTWAFRTRTWGRPGYTVLEGVASVDGQTEEFFLVVRPQHASLDVQSLRGFTDKLLDLFSTILGKPETGPVVVNIGELMDSLNEAPVNATWSFAADRRDQLLIELERLLCGGSSRETAVAEGGDTRVSPVEG
jgi:hypothetical protein